MKNEPVILINAIAAVVTALIVFLVKNGTIQVSPDAQDQLLVVVGLVATAIATWISRSQVTPVSRVA